VVICPGGEAPVGLTGVANPSCITEPTLSQTPTSITVAVPTFVLGANGGGFNSENYDVYDVEAAQPFYANLTGGGYSPSGTLTDLWSNPFSLTLQVAVTAVNPNVIAAGTPVEILGSGFGKDEAPVSTGPDQVFFCPIGVSPGASGTSSCTVGTSEVNVSDGEITVVAPPPPAGSSGAVNLYVEVIGDDSLLNGLEGKVLAWSFPYQVTYSACGSLINCSQGTSSVPGGTATATSTDSTGSITATAAGTGAVTVGRYAANPVGAPSFTTGGSYFDVAVSDTNTFTSASIKDCDLGGATSVQWWNPAANGGAGGWAPVSSQTAPSGNPACITMTISAATSPTLAQLEGTVFVGEVSGNDSLTIKAAGPKFSYDISGLSTTGLITITSSGKVVNSVSGTITMPGETGGIATVSVSVVRTRDRYAGYLKVADPSAGLTLIVPVLLLVRSSAATVTIAGIGVIIEGHRLIPYQLTATLTQRA